ncbi:MAG: hypothetical protein HJJLKODD_01993 [Phycisphaerae bacterium]|nr:hypothetical protein [Phycisphaerae bacterium]
MITGCSTAIDQNSGDQTFPAGQVQQESDFKCTRTYYDANNHIGFNPPTGFAGPYLNSTGDILFVVDSPDNVVEEQTQITVVQFIREGDGLLHEVNEWIDINEDNLLSQQQFQAQNGNPATLLFWKHPDTVFNDPVFDIYYVESWIDSGDYVFSIRYSAFSSEYFVNESSFIASAMSICTD